MRTSAALGSQNPVTYEPAVLVYPVPPEIKTVLKVMDAIDRRDTDLLKPENYTLEVQRAFRAAVGFDEMPPIPDASDFESVMKYHCKLICYAGYEERCWGYRQLRACAHDGGTAFLTGFSGTDGFAGITSLIRNHLESPRFRFDGALSDYLQKNPSLMPLPPHLDQYVFLTLSGYASRHILSLLDSVLTGYTVPEPGETLAQTAYRDSGLRNRDDPHAYAADYVLGFAKRYGLLEG